LGKDKVRQKTGGNERSRKGRKKRERGVKVTEDRGKVRAPSESSTAITRST